MEVTRYIFQSPYSSQIQMGKPDLSSLTSDKNESGDSDLINSTNKVVNDAKFFESTQTQEVKPTVDSSSLLDVLV